MGGLSNLAEIAIMANIEKDNRDLEERISAPILVLRQGTPISEISGRDLPSPADIKGDQNVLLLPFYQEIEKKEDDNTTLETLSSRGVRNNGGHLRSKSAIPTN